ncbi:hypothetical protein ACKVMT_04200 [Halobacteriales archaeon Cl-PHB]
MSNDRDSLAAFDADRIAAVATESDISADALETLVQRHQAAVRDLPGVEDIVYEWRTQFHEDPLRDQTSEHYLLVLRDHVWEEFADSLDLSAAELTALQAVHQRQAEAILDEGALDGGLPMVLTRP